MYNFIKYFIDNKNLNHFILLFFVIIGVNSYIKIPKEMFPVMELDKIQVTGSYSGISVDNMDKIAVKPIEDSFDTVSNIKEIETTIKAGRFEIILTLNENVDKNDVLNKIKDSISTVKSDLPSDMDEPTAKLVDKMKDLVGVSIGSNVLSREELIKVADNIKKDLSKYEGVSNIDINGESDMEVYIKLKTPLLDSLNISYSSVINEIKNLSYLFPIAEIKNKKTEIYLSTINGKKTIKEWEETYINVNNKRIKLKDIAEVNFQLSEETTLSSFNQKRNISLSLSKTNTSNSMEIVEKIKEYIANYKNKDIELSIYNDSSKPVKDRLNTVISNLTFGLVLVFLSMYILINKRIATVVTLGIPFSFLIGIIFIYYAGYTINVVSLLGALIVIGIVVDDAVVIAENIQRHIDEGMDRKEAAIIGTQEMLKPVTLATLTTFAAFIPMFMISGEMGLFLILIPIMVIMILLGSLIESIFFLPLHSYEYLKPTKNIIDWTPIQNFYEKKLKILIKYKKTFLLSFLIITPLLTFYTASQMKFQFFPVFDGNNLSITGKVKIGGTLQDTYKLAQEIESELLKEREKFFIKNSNLKIGVRNTTTGNKETGDNMFLMRLELYDFKSDNFIDKYVNPVLNFSFEFNNENEKRTEKTFIITNQFKPILDELQRKYNIEELAVIEDKPGLIKSDIKIDMVSSNKRLVEESIFKIENELKNIKGIKDYSNNIIYGKDEYKISISNYGENLGITESFIAENLGLMLSERKISRMLNSEDILEVKVVTENKDEIENLMNMNIKFNDKFYKMKYLINYEIIKDYEKIEKTNGEIIKTVLANVDPKIITATEVIEKLKPILSEIEKQDIKINLKGEEEKKKELANDMIKALILTFFLMIIFLLLEFPKIKYVFMIISVIPFSLLGAFVGHLLLGINLTMPSIIGLLGLAGVVINDGIIMLEFLHGTHKSEEFFKRAKMRLRPILITSITTFLGMFTLIFYATGQAILLQPIAVSIGFGLIWGTVLNLLYLPTLYALINKIEVK